MPNSFFFFCSLNWCPFFWPHTHTHTHTHRALVHDTSVSDRWDCCCSWGPAFMSLEDRCAPSQSTSRLDQDNFIAHTHANSFLFPINIKPWKLIWLKHLDFFCFLSKALGQNVLTSRNSHLWLEDSTARESLASADVTAPNASILQPSLFLFIRDR